MTQPSPQTHVVFPTVHPVPELAAIGKRLDARAERLIAARRIAEGRLDEEPLSHAERTLMRRAAERAERLHAKALKRSGTQHLRPEMRARLQAAPRPMRLAGPVTRHAADELAAALLDEMPWMQPALDPLWRDLRAAAAEERGLGLRPILLVGPPGIGKTHLARRLAALAGVPFAGIDLGVGSEAFAIAGLSRGWGSSMIGRPLETILTTGIANPVILVDEIEKGRGGWSTKGDFTSAHNALLPLLEPATAARFQCPCLDVPADLSRVSWVLCANSQAGMPAPLLSRVTVVDLPALTAEQTARFAHREGARRGLGSDALRDLVRAILAAPPGGAPDLRGALRMVEGLVRIEAAEAVH
ncbi:AAA family ATPase [Pseudoroseicyclus aestuarii]|uniref:ATPase family protein associated with various cellular activities (AAA) n=1 Tax=Pseudoroseicyclus aestuarii TaxID=1795041 RepID=A0A318SM40_9RHOB|nr:AAA family ATPase [Pseudoroseicyclus aestuarii]PYE80863.1 ATPase family protein associated with various cellular activities (AAA) [Pseudoroseicyclus aestuarii]